MHRLFALLFIIPGIALMLGARRIARYSREVRERRLHEAQRRVEQGSKLAKLKTYAMNGALEAGQMDELFCYLVGSGTIALGIFAFFHPHGW